MIWLMNMAKSSIENRNTINIDMINFIISMRALCLTADKNAEKKYIAHRHYSIYFDERRENTSNAERQKKTWASLYFTFDDEYVWSSSFTPTANVSMFL